MFASRDAKRLEARAEKAEALVAQLTQQLADERQRNAAQKNQIEQLEQQVDALLTRLYHPDSTSKLASEPSRLSISLAATQESPRGSSKSKSDKGIVREVSKEVKKKSTSFIRTVSSLSVRITEALPIPGSRHNSPPRSATATPRKGSQIVRPSPSVERLQSAPARDNSTIKHGSFVQISTTDKLKERTSEPGSNKDRRNSMMMASVRGVPGEMNSAVGVSMRRLRSMHVAAGAKPASVPIRRAKSEEQLASWDYPDVSVCRRASSKALMPQLDRPRAVSSAVSVLEQDYRDSGNPAAPKKDQTDLVYSPRGTLKAASTMRFVDFLITQNTDPEAVRTFIISYRLFEKPAWLLANLSFSFGRAANESVRRRIMFIVRRWLECAPCDFADPTMRSMLVRFLERDVRKRAGMEQHAAGLLRLISDNDSTSSLDCSHSGSSSSASSRSSEIEIANVFTYLDTPIAKLELLSVDPCVLAEQLTLTDHGLFRRISVTHWLANCNGKWTNTPVQALAQRFNNISAYFTFEIVTTFHLKKRAALLKHLIVTARRLFVLNNFHGLMAVLSALSNSAVGRLKRTWRALPSSIRSMYLQLEDVTDPKGNFQAYRQAIKRVTPPAVPYVAVCMRDLTVIHEANQSLVGKGLMNLEKCELLAKVISDFETCKAAAYRTLEPVPALQKYIDTFGHSLNESVINDNTMHAFSLRCEPRAVEL